MIKITQFKFGRAKILSAKLFGIFAITLFFPGSLFCQNQPAKLPLSQESTADVRFQSNLISTNAKLKQMEGFLTITGEKPEDINIFLNAQSNNVAFGNLPFDQMLILTGLLKATMHKELTFKSTDIVKTNNGYLISGIATSGRNQNKVSIPATITKTNSAHLINATYEYKGKVGNKNFELTDALGPVKTTGNLKLIFK